MAKEETAWEPTVGSNVLVLTPTYHWVGRIAFLNPVVLRLADATFFVDIGQADGAASGNFSQETHGRQMGNVEITRIGAQIIEYTGKSLPKKPIGN